MFSIKFTIQSDTRYLVVLRQLIAAISTIVGEKRFPNNAKMACTLSLIEAVNNAIFHAHKHKLRLPVSIMLSVNKGEIVLEVIDKGMGLNHPDIHEPNLLSTKGRGLYIMDELMDSVESVKTKEGHKLTLKYKV